MYDKSRPKLPDKRGLYIPSFSLDIAYLRLRFCHLLGLED